MMMHDLVYMMIWGLSVGYLELSALTSGICLAGFWRIHGPVLTRPRPQVRAPLSIGAAPEIERIEALLDQVRAFPQRTTREVVQIVTLLDQVRAFAPRCA
jgi:hypothetical protein